MASSGAVASSSVVAFPLYPALLEAHGPELSHLSQIRQVDKAAGILPHPHCPDPWSEGCLLPEDSSFWIFFQKALFIRIRKADFAERQIPKWL